MRRNLHLGVGFLAATSGLTDPGRLRFRMVVTRRARLSVIEAGSGPAVIAVHGLGGTKGSFLPTVAALSGRFRVIAPDLPGFGDSDKPIGASYDARFFARAIIDLIDALKLDRAHLIGNSLGGRVALEVGLLHPERVGRLALLAPSLAWRRGRPWAPLLRLTRPELGLVQLAPRPIIEAIVHRLIPGAEHGWTAAGVDEFLRAYLTPAGRAAFYAAARHIYLEEPRRRGRLLDATSWSATRAAVHLGSQRRTGPDCLRAPRRRRAAAGSSDRTRLRARAADRAPGPDPRCDQQVPGTIAAGSSRVGDSGRQGRKGGSKLASCSPRR